MARLKDPNTAPPGGFSYRENRSGLTLTGTSLQDLTARLIDHRRYRGWWPQDAAEVSLEIQRQLCRRLGSAQCKSEGPDDPWKPVDDLTLNLGLSHVLAASRAFLEWLSSGFGTATMEETLRRRSVCLECPLNRPAAGCKCDVLYKAIAAAVPTDRQFGDAHICGACGCSLKAKLSAPAAVIAASEKGRNLQYPAECWVPDLLAKQPPTP